MIIAGRDLKSETKSLQQTDYIDSFHVQWHKSAALGSVHKQSEQCQKPQCPSTSQSFTAKISAGNENPSLVLNTPSVFEEAKTPFDAAKSHSTFCRDKPTLLRSTSLGNVLLLSLLRQLHLRRDEGSAIFERSWWASLGANFQVLEYKGHHFRGCPSESGLDRGAGGRKGVGASLCNFHVWRPSARA